MSTERRPRRGPRWAFALAALSLLPTAGCAHDRADAATGAAPPATHAVKVARAELRSERVGEDVVGTVRARASAAIASSIMGRVRELPVSLGTRVRRGQLLARLSAGEIDARAAQADAVLARAKTDLARAEELRRTDAISQAALDAANAEFRVAQAAHREANAMRAYTELRAPFDAVVSEKGVEVGDVAVPGRPLLVVEDPSSLRLEITVPETAARTLPVGTRTTARVDSLARELDVAVAEVSPTADPASRTVLVKLDLPRDAELRAGLFGRVCVTVASSQTLVVPTDAVVRRGQLEEVFVVDGARARLRLVRTGGVSERGTVILGGLDEGEAVVVSGAAGLVDGQPVEVAL